MNKSEYLATTLPNFFRMYAQELFGEKNGKEKAERLRSEFRSLAFKSGVTLEEFDGVWEDQMRRMEIFLNSRDLFLSALRSVNL